MAKEVTGIILFTTSSKKSIANIALTCRSAWRNFWPKHLNKLMHSYLWKLFGIRYHAYYN